MSYEWFHAVAERLTEPVLLLTPDGTISACNRASRRVLGAEAVGKCLPELTTGSAACRRYLSLAARSASPLPGALRLSNSASSWRCDASVAVTQDGPCVIVHLRESTESVRRFTALNEQIARLQAETRQREKLERERELLLSHERDLRLAMEEANRFKDELLASISHELRTPLQAISGWLALIKDAPHDRTRLLRGLEVMERNVIAQNQLTEDLVDTALVITGRMRLELQPVDLEQVIRLAAESAMPAVSGKGQRIEVVANVGSCVVNGDPDRLFQIVWNLLANAAKYTPNGGKIQVVLRRVKSHAEILVSDTGEGIGADFLPYVFDRFRRADGGSTRRHGGLGLGLSIVRHLVELHGGVVMAQSDGAGKGSTFTVNLPLRIYPGKSAAPAPDHALAVSSQALADTHVLLVEDHEDSRELLTQVLAGQGARVTAVDCAHKALEAFEREPVDMIVSDIEMPGEDGFTLMRKLRDLERKLERRAVPSVAVSAHSIGDARLHAMRAGYQAFMPKPLEPAELVATLASLYENQNPTSGAS